MKQKLSQLFGWAALVAIVFGVAQLTEAQSSGGFPSRPTFLSGVVRGLWAMQSCTVGGVACATGTIPTSANPTATVGPTATNGSGTAYMLANAAPPLCETCVFSFTPASGIPLSVTAIGAVGLSLIGGNTSTGAALLFTDGHAGAQAFQAGAGITTAGHFQIYDATGGATRFDMTAAGNVSIPSPVSGSALTVTGATAAGNEISLVAPSGAQAGLWMTDGQTGNGLWQILDGYCGGAAPNTFGLFSNTLNASPFCISATGAITSPSAISAAWPATTTIGGTSVCLSSGTNCPTIPATSTGTGTFAYSSGCTAGTAAGTYAYNKIGNLASVVIVTITASCGTGASAGTALVFTGLAAAITPAANRIVAAPMNTTSGGASSACTFTTGNTLSCVDTNTSTSTGFLVGGSYTYTLN